MFEIFVCCKAKYMSYWQIHITFGPEDDSDDEDFEESSGWYGDGSTAWGKIPIVCKDHPRFPVSKAGLENAEDPLIVSGLLRRSMSLSIN
jgi:hypothetical protein